MTSITEKKFEDEITASLVAAGGYSSCKVGTDPTSTAEFDALLGLDTAELLAFIAETQTADWAKLLKAHGGDESAARGKFAKRLAQQIDERGTVDVLRHGVTDQNVLIRLSFRQPAFTAAPELVSRYDANRLTVTRQLPFEPGSTKTLDLCLFLNGIPVATAELKNHLTGQTVEHAIEQYRSNRDPKNVTLDRRALVHFAVDPDAVAMTTKLDGESTRFLPFNRGNGLAKGNPPNPHGHKTSYLWEHVWAKDAWLDILHRFIHVERPSKGSAAQKKAAEMVIFPRYHQWDAVTKLDARANGAGSSYLIQHSAGSGKSNTIAWTAHRLSTLHDETDNKVFDKVIVITDRVILDKQLQDTIYQFEHAHGVVERINQNSQQLADALMGKKARIIITTLQKFPFVLDKMTATTGKSYAIVIDEAHSSQGGEAAKDLKVALGAGGDVQELTVAEAEDRGLIASAVDPVEEALIKSAAARGAKQPNLSYFAFTATPKGKTLETFGLLDPKTGKFGPFHLYSMRQAIEEGFIMDVLSNYTTYHTFWKIEKTVEQDPEYDAKKARRAIAQFVSLHPYQLEQKAQIIVEHFRQHTRKEMHGQAKAMVVTSSRLHAVRYKNAIDKYIAEHPEPGQTLATLVAFSGTVDDPPGVANTEAGMNQLPESQTAATFDTDEYSVLIVAEKFQTGFDQPLLQTMFVDKTLVGLAAVQTLSRLNRIHPLKERTFVLDFRNQTEDIVKAFEEFHGVTVAPPTDPNILSDTRAALDQYDVLRLDEIEAAMPALLDPKKSSDQQSAATYAALGPAKARVEVMPDEDALIFRDALRRFVRTYSFVSQIAPFIAPELERDYIFCRALALYLRDHQTVEKLDLGTEVQLSAIRNQLTYEGGLALTADVGEVQSFYGTGKGSQQQQLELERLSDIVEVLNDKFGTSFTATDGLLITQIEGDCTDDEELVAQAKSNSIENFKLPFDAKFMSYVLSRMDMNDDFFKQMLDNPEFRGLVKDHVAASVYNKFHDAA